VIAAGRKATGSDKRKVTLKLEVESMKRTGFTLVEILIVVIILGILAAIVIPQFTQASNDARESALSSDLQTLRSQIELYKVQHLERLPSIDENNALDTANFGARMTGRTDNDGALNAAGLLGPYLQKAPTNPFVAANGDQFSFGTAAVSPGDDTTGWYFNTDTGAVWPNDAAHLGL
jgi:general secretion pathway protein G